jgi:hypothetical protein
MPRTLDFRAIKPAIQTITLNRPLPCYTKQEQGQTTYHDTIRDVVKSAKSGNFSLTLTYPDRYDNNGNPTTAIGDTDYMLTERLCYEKFVLPTLRPRDDEEQEEE